MKKIGFAAALGALVLAACVRAGAAAPYTVSVAMPEDTNELMAYLVDYDSGEKIDSTVVARNEAVFEGTVEKPVMARLVLGGSRLGTFVLEPGDITFHPDRREATGSPLNVRLNIIADSLQSIERAYAELPRDSAFESRARSLSDLYNLVESRAVKENADNPIGLYFFLQNVYSLQSKEEFDRALAEYPSFALSSRVRSMQRLLGAREETSVGKRFKDFAVPHHEKTDSMVRLSDYVGRGKWVLVDFWASWCGPCIRETKVIKEILADYAPLGLEVLGVAVWDEPANTLDAVGRHQLSWPQIVGAQSVPTDLYGIAGIPCIILFDPQGNIVARDLQGEDLKRAVHRALVP